MDTVRSNWLQFSWNQISGANKVMLILSFSLSLLQIIVTSIILGIGGSLRISCDKPLQLYLIIFVVRVGISIPFTVYQHLSIPRRSTTVPVVATAAAVIRTTEQCISPTSTTNTNNDTTTTTEQHTSALITLWTDRIKSILDLFAILWFIVGNYLVFSPSDCSYNAATYFYTILTWVLFGYLILLFPVLIFFSVIFCLPCVLGTIVMAMRTFNINASSVMVGATREEISKIPIFKYKTTSTTNSSSGGFLHALFARQIHKASPEQHYDDLMIPQTEDAVCSICLSEYQENDLICKLWCKHHFHRDCVHEWLGLNSTCPLCKRDFRGANNSSLDEE